MKIAYKSAAVHDLHVTADYIAHTLKNPKAAQKWAASVLRAVSLLAENPQMGAALQEKFDIKTDLRYFIVSKHFVFYRVGEEQIEIVRILDGRRDYMALLFQEKEEG